MRSRIFMMFAIPTAVACGDTKTSSRADDTAMNTSDAADGESDGNPSEDAGCGDDEGTDTGDSESGATAEDPFSAEAKKRKAETDGVVVPAADTIPRSRFPRSASSAS